MKKSVFVLILAGVILIALAALGIRLTGEAVKSFGPGESDVQCMMGCMGCTSPGVGCTGNQEECQARCNVQKPEQTEEEKCVETCAMRGCGEYDFSCQQKNQAVCDAECGMKKEPPAKNEEEQCIRDCVNQEQEGLICGGGEGGEKGNEVCQRCAQQCEHLYEGPCLTESKLDEKKRACPTCEHCYAKPVMGDSGEGYECIVSVECADASGEFRDNPGSGTGIGKEEARVGVIESVGNFFGDLFGSG